MKYESKNGILPTSIVIYRDGVGEGQISHVYKTEIKLFKVCVFYWDALLLTWYDNIYFVLQAACQQFYGSDSIPLVFIIVTKRISTRFFANVKQGAKAMNPQPGTVVDSVVTDPTKYDE